MSPLLLLYAAGVAVGLWRVDGPAMTRVTLAALWPLGVAAAAVTAGILIAAATVLFPLFGALLGVLLLGLWLWF